MPWPLDEAKKLLALIHLLGFKVMGREGGVSPSQHRGLDVLGKCHTAFSFLSLNRTVDASRARQRPYVFGILHVHPSAGHLALGNR